MILKNFRDYLKYSGLWISFAINPMHWTIGGSFQTPTESDPAYYGFYFTFGPLTVRAAFDDGSW